MCVWCFCRGFLNGKKVTWVLVASVLGLLSIIYFFFLELLVLAIRVRPILQMSVRQADITLFYAKILTSENVNFGVNFANFI